jgi:ribosomal protein L21E
MTYTKVLSLNELKLGTKVRFLPGTEYPGKTGKIIDVDNTAVRVLIEEGMKWWVMSTDLEKEQEYDFPVI